MFARFPSALDALLALQDSVEAARTSDYFGLSTINRGSFPSINIFQDGDDTVLMAEVPGMKKEDIHLEIKDNLITLSGERKLEYPEKASIHRVERRSRKFSRSVKLNNKVDVVKVKADYKDGILKVVLPRAESDKPKMIDIN
jgi:HSP20 family protein